MCNIYVYVYIYIQIMIHVHIYIRTGRVSTVRAVHKNEMAFVKFTSALDAEKALTAAATRPLSISGLRIHVSRST